MPYETAVFDWRAGDGAVTSAPPDERLAMLGDAMGERLDGVKGKTLKERLYRDKR